jgi:hypothetical protein
MNIPSPFYQAADEANTLRAWLIEARTVLKLPTPSTHGQPSAREPSLTLNLVMHALKETLPPTYGPWTTEQRMRAGATDPEAESATYSITVRKLSTGEDIAWITQGMWWPQYPLDAGEVTTINPDMPDHPATSQTAWKWSAAGRWGFANPREEAMRIADEVLASSGYKP